ncbi:MAG: MMPL family transporter, partial [Solirubrobacteraceae bacterium]
TGAMVAVVLAGGRFSPPPPPLLPRLWSALAPSLRGAELLLKDNWAARAVGARTRAGGSYVFERAVQRPERALLLAGVLAVLGWVGGTQTHVESDVQKLVPQSLPALRDLSTLQRSTHVGGEIDVLVRAADLTQPAVVSWMTAYQQRVEARFGGLGCGQAQLCPAFSLPDLFQNQGAPQQPTQADIRTLLDAVPPYFAQGVISSDRRTATLAFGIRLMALDQQKRVIDGLRAELHTPPGVSAQLVGLPVLVADANAQIASPWRRLGGLLFGLLAVATVLLGTLRSRRRALVPLIPIAFATGWSSLVLWAIQVPLNPMSVTLGALVIAISTEFSVLLSERYRQERSGGLAPRAALERTYRSTGAAVLASGATAIAGFAVLTLSDISMLRNFGVSTVVDLGVSLLGVLALLPAVLLLAERERSFAWRTILRPLAT